jgi:hypothetical protein
VELPDDLFDQSVLLQHFRLRLHINRIVGAWGRGGIDVAKIEEILVDSLDLDGCLRLVYARLSEANEDGGDHAEARDPQQSGLAPVERPHALPGAPLLAVCKACAGCAPT